MVEWSQAVETAASAFVRILRPSQALSAGRTIKRKGRRHYYHDPRGREVGVGALGVAAVQGDGREAAKSCKSLSREGPPTANRVSPFHSVSPMPQGWKERAPPLLIQNANGPLEPLRDRLETPSPFARSEVVTTPHHTDGREVLGFQLPTSASGPQSWSRATSSSSGSSGKDPGGRLKRRSRSA